MLLFVPPKEVRLVATIPGGGTVQRSFTPDAVKPGDLTRARLELTRRYGKGAVKTVTVHEGIGND